MPKKAKIDSQGLRNFVELCRHLDREQIYHVFNSEVLKERIRNEVYEYSRIIDNEPCRAAMIRLGEKYGVQSLIDY